MIATMNGARGWSCYQAYVSFIYYIHLAKTYRKGFDSKEEMIEHFKQCDEEQKRKIVTEIMSVNPISSEDMLSFVGVHKTNHGGYIVASSVNNFTLNELAEMTFESILRCCDESDQVFF